MAADRIAIFPGSFDPPTLGHVDLITRATALFDRVIVGLLENSSKAPMFPVEERVAMLREVLASEPRVTVEAFRGLLVDYAKAKGATVIVRGVRSGTDLDYERPMAATNRHLDGSIDTVFLMPSIEYAHVSSSLVREIAGLGGSVRGLVPSLVETKLAAKLAARARGAGS